VISRTFDVLVAGGGPAGSALSLRLARAGCAVAQLERTSYNSFRVGESLPPNAARQLMRLGVWGQFLQTGPTAVYGVQSAWGTSELDTSSFLTHPFMNGWHVDRGRLDLMLGRCSEDAGTQSFRGIAALRIRRDPGGFWSAKAACEGRTLGLNARFLVDATGRSGNLYTALGTRRTVLDHLIGIALMCPLPRADDPIPSLIEAHPLGWWYSAGLPDGFAIAIFFTDGDLCSKMGLTRPERLHNILTETRHTQERFKSAQFSARVRVFPAGSHCLQHATGDSWVAIGDAVVGRDPLSSSGIDFALASAERAYRSICSKTNGITEDVNKYDEQIRDDFQAYMVKRDAYYGVEDRWPTSAFWCRRHPAAMRQAGSALRLLEQDR
jgi:flavin-dependent dehydrogenase